jgi:uncharacterized protein YPO0396
MKQTNVQQMGLNLVEGARAGFRLQYLEVLNWGTFHQERWVLPIGGDNALLTGDIGSGKSTLVDALTCLLVPHNRIVFNKAAGAEGRERSLLSYVRGEYKKEQEETTRVARRVYLRDEDSYSVIIGNFRNEGYMEDVCLVQVFWTGREGKVEKLLLLSTAPLNIREHFSGITDPRELRRRLSKMDNVELFDDNFSRYGERFRRMLGMNSEKAVDLFYQTVSMKSVGSLTQFVREQMLEGTDVRQRIAELVQRFEDLKKAYAAVVHARRQHEILKPLAEASAAYDATRQRIADLDALMESIPSWFAGLRNGLLDKAIMDAREHLLNIARDIHRLDERIRDGEERCRSLERDIEQNGGKRIEKIEEELRSQEEQRKTKKRHGDDYDRLARQAGLDALEDEEAFRRNILLARERQAALTTRDEAIRSERDEIVGQRRRVLTDLSLEEEELQSLRARRTQIPRMLVDFRERLCGDLRLSEDDLPFSGELLRVREDAVEWEGAVERLLHEFGVTMLVPRKHYRSVSRYINANPLRTNDGKGILLTYFDVDLEGHTRVIKELDTHSVVYKLDVRQDSPFSAWLETHLSRQFGDYLCVELEQLAQVPFGITRQGLVKANRIRHRKDDRHDLGNRRHYVLGWSNADKVRLLEARVAALKDESSALQERIGHLESEEQCNRDLSQVLQQILGVSEYLDLDWRWHAHRIEELNAEKRMLLDGNDVLAHLQQKLTLLTGQVTDSRSERDAFLTRKGGLESEINGYLSEQVAVRSMHAAASNEMREKWHPRISADLREMRPVLGKLAEQQDDYRRKCQGARNQQEGQASNHRSIIEKRMHEIKTHSEAEYGELAQHVDAREEYLEKFRKLVKEDLRRHEERFKSELNKHVINSIAVFDNQLEEHEKEMRRKVQAINAHLRDIVYNAVQDTYITIRMDPTPSHEIRLFREQLRNCYRHSFSSGQELYTEEKYALVKAILDRFQSVEGIDREWTARVTDVRQWFEFNASECYRADDSEKEYYEGSGGKSGGQKEKLAYTILASALAYQFGLSFGESKSRSFRFVAIDEAFGRGSDESTRYGLELFKKLDLQLLIVTPLQKINIIERHVRSVHLVSNREGNRSEVTSLSIDAYLERKGRDSDRPKDAAA